jgi:hypothetical protein
MKRPVGVQDEAKSETQENPGVKSTPGYPLRFAQRPLSSIAYHTHFYFGKAGVGYAFLRRVAALRTAMMFENRIYEGGGHGSGREGMWKLGGGL